MLDRSPRAYRENIATLQHAQKSGAGVPAYMRWVNRWLGRRIAAAAAAVGLTPNGVTAISALCSLAGLVLLVVAEPRVGTGIAVALLLALGFACDSADGQLARLTGAGGPAGEWMDHVVDAIRTPLTHVAVAVALVVHRPDLTWAAGVALAYAVVSAGQFMSQILAEQLVRQRGGEDPEPSGVRKSIALIPTDTGTLCWSFALWGAPLLFVPVYLVLFAVNAVYAVVSMRRKYRKLRAL
ncbi:CDP-alcohol phosphatidyltransferase family protein [Leucobacter chironomi]|uniref:CDP-alcohol phosphatidyltransferase family protein n=1 Tax=Leucobacter chironomi TaxID=491918 RepID=UPI000410F52E|nr:CDP-alcohol phosphatidyltransferase family protein [Leucobacter chironomi]